MESGTIKFLKETACFDLQFRRDVRHKRNGSPVYYSWKAQFVITGSIEKEDLLREIQNILNCGKVHYITGTRLRFSVQNINDLHDKLIPFFEKHKLAGKKKYDFELWSKAVKILYKNKAKALLSYPKQDLLSLINAQKEIVKYKTRKTQFSKWLPEAESIIKRLGFPSTI